MRRFREDRRVLFTLHAVLVVAFATWVRSLSAPAGAVAAVAALAAATVTWRAGRRLATMALAAIGVAGAMLVAEHARDRRAVVVESARPEADRGAPYERALVEAITATHARLAAAADSAAGGTKAVGALPQLPSDAGLVVFYSEFNGERPLDWAGRVTVRTTRVAERAGVIVTPLYVVQFAASVSMTDANLRVVATSIVQAMPPADRLSRSLADVVGRPHHVSFDIEAGTAERITGRTTVDLGGTRLAIRARVPDAQSLMLVADERARTKGTVLLLIATMIALAIWWRRAEHLPERLLATSLPLAALAIAPLNRLSNVTRLFDPATYFVPIGGPFTASIGALALTSALVLFAVMAGLRDRAQPRRKRAAGLAVLVIAFASVFLMRDLGRGVSMPPNGATTGLWLAWEVGLFLAATSLLAAGVTAGQWALGARRGLPLWLAPLIAAGAAILGPLQLTGSARWPAWYPALWIAAIAALALARRSRAVLFPSAIVASCGVVVLLWNMTLRERAKLAEDDVRALSSIDANTTALVERFASDLAGSAAPTTSEELLVRYASADLSAVNYPVVLGHWPAVGGPVMLSPGDNDDRRDEVGLVVAEARATNSVVMRPLAASPAASLVVAVPHADGVVTTALVGARTRLTRPNAFANLMGLAGEPVQPPYQLTNLGTAHGSDEAATPWTKRGSHLHADWPLPSGTGGTVRVHASVAIDPYETLYPRGLLVVLLNLFIVLVLLAIDLLADGALWRWVRTRRSQWAHSYRLKLTLALFAFFVVPALTFALWSYRRLQADDRVARELLVRESLRRAAVVVDTGSVMTITGVPPDIPFLAYRGGELVFASNPLLLSVAPVGLWLMPQVKELLDGGEDLIAAAALDVGGHEMLFGFRPLARSNPQLAQLVAAVPARRDEAALDKRRSDLAVLVALATVLGALAALGLSGVAGRQLARPIGTLRGAAIAIAGGSRAPINAPDAPAEFVPVFRAFDRMARDLAESESQLSRAQRVFAWGEMARQVAHEIKNPLTPIRLGVQHLLRAWHDARPDFGTILEENSARVLREIDHLDATARSFSQYGTSPGEPVAVEAVDVAAVARDVVALEALGADGLTWIATGADAPCWARARADELREVLLNLCENARLAGARRVELRVGRAGDRVTLGVADDGEGVAPHVRTRVFEPHFSTRTSGSGLGLAISRRLVEGWGGSIDLSNAQASGTIVELRLEPADPPA